MSDKTVCMLSCLHNLYDDRIYWKEALSLKKHGYNVIHLGVSNEEYDRVSKEGIRLISVKRRTYFSNPYIDKLYRALTFRRNIYTELLQICKNLHADIYHLHDLQINRIGLKLKKLSHQPKLIYDVHEPYPVTLAETETKLLIGRLFWKIFAFYINYWEISKSRNYDLIIATEENVANRFHHNLKNIPVDIIYNYIDKIPSNNHKVKEFDFIYSGGIRRRRGIFEILSALNELKEKKIEARTLIIGHIHDNGLKQDIHNYINTHNLENNILLKDFIPYSEIHLYYELSKFGLAIFNKSKVNETIMPIKIFEYITYRLPVITSNFGHLKEITEKHETGICVNPNDINSISVYMGKLLTDHELHKRYVSNCEKASKLFLWTHMEQKLIKLYKQILFK